MMDDGRGVRCHGVLGQEKKDRVRDGRVPMYERRVPSDRKDSFRFGSDRIISSLSVQQVLE